MQALPLVTVYIPTKNRLPLLKRAVESVLHQDYKNIELIIVDDGSEDGTSIFLEALARKENRVKYLLNEEPFGACVSRNKAIWAAKGEFITGLDDDDIFLPGRLSQFVKSWAPDEGLQAIYTDAQIKYSKNDIKITNRPWIVTLDQLAISNYIGNQIFCQTTTLRQIRAFNPEVKIWQDLDCWMRLLSTNSAKAKKIGTATYLIDKSHPHESITKKNQNKVIDSYIRIVREVQLNKKNSARLKAQLYLYVPEQLRFSEMIQVALRSRCFRTVCKLIRAFVGGYLKRKSSPN